MNISGFQRHFNAFKPVIGMVHLLPLPGSPGFGGSMDRIVERAVLDARALCEGGADGVIVENFGDAPFCPRSVGPEITAAMTLAVHEIRKIAGCSVGVNVLRNDAMTSLAIATVLGCDFVRVNVHTGVVATDQGMIEGRAFETLRYRDSLGSQVLVFADVFVKHGRTLHAESIVSCARDTVGRGRADVLICTGTATGETTDVNQLKQVKNALPGTPVLAGSGVNKDNIRDILAVCDGVIVGTAIKEDGEAANPVDPERIRHLVAIRNDFGDGGRDAGITQQNDASAKT
ncbi:BtpA/SgcQ family protein [bacterium]|nr:BtpA/SgcQ family protein [bacterium]